MVPCLRAALSALVFLALAPAHALELAPEAKEVEDCMRKNLPKDTSFQTVVLRRAGADGVVAETRASVWWRRGEDGRNQARLLFSSPDDLRGAGLLLVEREGANDLFMYLPELRRVRRVTGHMMSGSMFGTDFTYEQIERLQGLAQDATVKRLADGREDAGPVYVLEARPAQKPGEESQLTRVVSYVAKDTCVPVKMEFYGAGEKPTHVLVADAARVTKEPSGYVPRRVVMKDLKKGTETELVVESIEVGKPLSSAHFSQSALEQAGR
jgi:hypothetical protein